MRHFSITAENNITAYASRKEARETNAGVFSTEEQFADLIEERDARLPFKSLQRVDLILKGKTIEALQRSNEWKR